jgi:cardiolipin synthase
MVTGHVLLHKEDVRSAAAWIGLAWLSPGFGAAVYFALGINRVARRASQINREAGRSVTFPESPPFSNSGLDDNIRTTADVGSLITGLPLTQGNSLTMLHSGDEAYPEMLAAIDNAQRTIALASYIFRPDRIGARFVDALIAASRRGVEIRVLVDGIGSGYFFSPVIRQLHRADIPATRFMHDWRPWRMSFINLRNHKKVMVIDGTHGFAGGLNFGVENIPTRRRRREVNDVHFRLAGPIVGQLMTSFAEDWHFTTGESLSGEDWWPDIESAGTVVARAISSGPDEDIGKIETVLATAIGQAQREIRIVTPYFLPDESLKSVITLAALRGVAIDLVLPQTSDHALMDWAMNAHLAYFPLELLNCHLTPEPFDHSKLMTVDGHWCAVGSPNWDVRSLRLNFELLLECYDDGMTADINRTIDEKIERARPLTKDELENRPLMKRLRDSSARMLLPYL